MLHFIHLEKAHLQHRGVLVFLIFWHFSSELTQTWTLGTTESGVWIGNHHVKARKTTEHILHKIWHSLKICKNFSKTSTPLEIISMWFGLTLSLTQWGEKFLENVSMCHGQCWQCWHLKASVRNFKNKFSKKVLPLSWGVFHLTFVGAPIGFWT